MSKGFKRIATIIGVAALAVTGIGLFVAPGALGALAGVSAAANAIGLSTLATIGLAGLSIGMSPNMPKTQEETGANKRGSVTIDPNALGVFAWGTTTVPCVVVFEQLHADEQTITNVMAHAWHRIESYQTLYVNGEQVSFSGNDATGDWSGLLTWRRADGSQVAALSLTGTSWPSTAIGTGVAHSAMTWNFKKDSDKLKGGVPIKIDVVVQGAWLYDPRLDPTYGSGTQDFDDPSTWSFNNGNAVLVLLRMLRGEYTSGGTLIWGRGALESEIDMDSFIAMANVADETVDGKPRFRLGGIHQLDGGWEGFVRRWEDETGGKLYKGGGLYKVWLPHDDLISATTITQDDLLLDEPVIHTIASGISGLYNTARGRYIEPTQGYRGFPYPEVSESSAVTDDGGKRVLYQDFSWVQDVSIAERIARNKIRRTRYPGIWVVAMGWKGWGTNYEPFTVHTLNIPETGNDAQLVRVIDRKLAIRNDGSGVATLLLQQEDASIYDDTVPLGDPHASNTTGPRVDRLGAVVPRYIDGTRIDDLRPNEAGADNTALHGINAVDNPEFEAGDTGWTKTAGWTIVEDAGNARRGSWALKATGADGATDVGCFNNAKLQVQPGDRLLGQCFIKKTAGAGSLAVFIIWWDSAGNSLGTSAPSYTSSSSYTQSRVVDVAPANAVSASVGVDIDGGDASTVAYVDGFFLSIIPKDADIDIAQASGHIVFRSSTAPSSPKEGWVWQDTDDSRVYRWSGAAWVQIGADDALLLGLNAPAEAGADNTLSALRGPFIFEATITIGNDGIPRYGYESGSYGSISADRFYDGRLTERRITVLRWQISATIGVVSLKLFGTGIANEDRVFSSLTVNGQVLNRSAATYTANDGLGQTDWSWGSLDTSGFPTSGTTDIEISSAGLD